MLQAVCTPVVEQMVTQQVRAWNVIDVRVLDVLRQTPRETFVPESLRHAACADAHLPMTRGQVMLAPKFEGKILQALNVQPDDQALVVGAANAHLAACLARLANKVTLLDDDAGEIEAARQRIVAAGVNNAHVQTAAWQQLSGSQAYDVIVVTGSLPTLPDAYMQALTINGRLFAVLGNEPVMEAVLVTRTGAQAWQQSGLFETVLPALSGAMHAQAFQF
jgi:protein-L-isoaspartate(D-aspartate) O-methyltransferase